MISFVIIMGFLLFVLIDSSLEIYNSMQSIGTSKLSEDHLNEHVLILFSIIVLLISLHVVVIGAVGIETIIALINTYKLGGDLIFLYLLKAGMIHTIIHHFKQERSNGSISKSKLKGNL